VVSRRRLAAVSIASAGLLALIIAGPVAAHAVEHAGAYTIEIGWQHEPTYVGETNGVQIIVTDANDKPVTDLTADDLQVVVSTGDQQSQTLTFDPGFDPEEMEGNLGEYDAAIMPTAPGDYTFHVTGSIHGTPVDLTVASGDETFNTVVGTSDIQFPTTLPTIAEITTRLDQIDSRVVSAQTAAGPTQTSVDAAAAAASDAQAAADRALLVAGGIAIIGLLVGAAGLLLAIRATRATQPPATG
jgi:hypothetical protein